MSLKSTRILSLVVVAILAGPACQQASMDKKGSATEASKAKKSGGFVTPTSGKLSKKISAETRRRMGFICTRGAQGAIRHATSVNHYFIPPGVKAGDYDCRNGYGYRDQQEMAGTCLHPCRSLAANQRFHRPGEIIFFENLVGKVCGSGKNKMIHDGFMVVTDNGNPESLNAEGRFGLFWGSCENVQNGFCQDEGAIALDFALTFSNYCRAWRPGDPLYNDDVKIGFYNKVRREAARRKDHNAASSFDLDEMIGLGVFPDGTIYRRNR